MRRISIGLLTILLLASVTLPLSAQGSLSAQVLRLLTRTNTWTQINTFAHSVGLKLERGTAPAATTDTLYNVGGTLFFNGSAIVGGGAGSGTVTSVALTMPGLFSVAGSPISTSGTFAVSLVTQVANCFLAGPSTGSPATPTCRAIVDADVPDTITIAGSNNVTWASVSKSGSSLADLATRSAADLSSGTLPDARFPATLPALSGVNLTALNASNLSSGTVAAARMPALSGDITSSAGSTATALSATGVSAATYTCTTLAVDVKGRITSASNGSCGGGGGGGTVTSVDMTVPSILAISGNPITITGTLALTLATQSANTFFAGPTTGSAATPAFRAVVDADIPDNITINGTNNVTWGSVSKSGSSLADLATRSAADLSSGTLPDARFPATLPAASGVNLTALNASNLGSGTVAAARMPALTGDITTSAGAVATTLANTAVTPGDYTLASISVDSKGRITAASSGSAGGTGTVTHTAGGLTASALVVGNGTADIKVLASLGATTTVLHGNAAGLPTFGAVSLTADVSGILPVANGGTNNAFFAVSGPASSAKTYTLPNSSTTILTTAAAITAAQGGTGIASYAIGDLLYASASTTLSKLADVATGNVLISGGVTTVPSWGKVDLTAHITGTLAHGNGGTDVTAVTDDTVLVANGSTWQSKALANGVLSYNTSTNSFSVPTTFILGTGAPIASSDNILLRSNSSGIFEVMLGNASAYATVKAAAFVGGVYSAPVISEGNSGTTKTIDLSTGTNHKVILTGNVTFTLSNPVDGGTYTLYLYTGAGSFTSTWPATVRWPALTPPIITATASRVDVVSLTWNANSGVYFASILQNYDPT